MTGHEPITRENEAWGGVYAITCSCYQWSAGGVGRTDLWDRFAEHRDEASGLVTSGQGGLW